jgi:CheY-like chemotaxis protein
MIADELGANGHQVEIARNGQEALMSLESSPPDAIVLDLMMPLLNGWDFVEQYHSRTGGQTIPIVVVSAAGAVPRSMEALGVKRFLRKPFALDALQRCISEVTADVALGSADGKSATAPAQAEVMPGQYA